MDNTRLSAQITSINGIPIVAVQGEIDLYTVPEFRKALQQVIDEEPSALIVDLREISYIDSAGLGALLAAFKTLSAHNAPICVVTGPDNPGVRRVLEITRLDTLMLIRNSVEDAVRDLSVSRAA